MIPLDKIRVEVDDCDCCGLNVGIYATVDGDEKYLGELGRFFTVQDIIDLATPENVEEPGYLKARGAVSGTEPAEVVIRRIRGQEENVDGPPSTE